jgi:hypothetical protein
VQASADCTSRADLMARVLARSPHVRFADDPNALAIRASFTIMPSGDVVTDLLLIAPGAKPSPRRLQARSCLQAADGAALIIAVTLDPAALGESRATPDREPASEASSGSARTGPPSLASAEAKPKPTLVQEPARGNIHAGDGSSTEVTRFRFGVYLAAHSVFGPAPVVMPGLAVYTMAGIDRPSVWSPAVVIGGAHVWRAGIEAEGGTASFALSAASLDVCPLRLGVVSFEGRACGSALLGRLAANGSETRNSPGTVTRPFAVAGGAAVMTLGVGSMLELSARAGAGATLVRDSFEFAPIVFHRAAPVTAFMSVGVGLRP